MGKKVVMGMMGQRAHRCAEWKQLVVKFILNTCSDGNSGLHANVGFQRAILLVLSPCSFPINLQIIPH